MRFFVGENSRRIKAVPPAYTFCIDSPRAASVRRFNCEQIHDDICITVVNFRGYGFVKIDQGDG